MDLVKTMYKELFNLKLVHKAYSPVNGNEIFNQLKVIPDQNTKTLFSRYGIDYRCINDTVVCFIRSELIAPPVPEPKKPFVHLDTAFNIRFLLTGTPGFFAKTYISAAGSKVVYHFT